MATRAVAKTKRPVGHPLKFKSRKELQQKIDEYFEYCDNRVKTTVDSEGREKSFLWPEPYTVGRLAVWLGTNRQTLINYGERDEFFDIIRNAKARIEADLEVRVVEARFPTGGIFVLKNGFNWRDETHSTIDANVRASNELTPEAMAILAKASRVKDGATKSLGTG